jgi:hypothetical protein
MNKLIAVMAFYWLCLTPAYTQQPDQSFSIWEYSPSRLKSFLYTDFCLSNSDFRSSFYKGISWADFNIFTVPKRFMQIDAMMTQWKWFKIGAASWFPQPETGIDLWYGLPVGLVIPVFLNEPYTFSISSTAYLLGISGLEDKDEVKVRRPRFIDNQIRIENNHFLRVTGIIGYRIQLTPWDYRWVSKPEDNFFGSLDGFYFGLGIGINEMETDGGMESYPSEFRKSQRGYGGFISTYPHTPYTTRKLIKRVACCDIDSVNRADAIRFGHLNEKLLKGILEKDNNPMVRIAVIEQLKDQTLLIRIASGGDVGKVRAVAIGRITNQAILADKALNDSAPEVRNAATERIDDQKTLIEIGLHDPSSMVRTTAASRITDETVLSRIVLNDSIAAVRAVTLGKVSNQETIYRVAMDDHDPALRLAAVKKLTDEMLIAKLIIEGKDPDCTAAVFGMIRNQKAFLEIALNSIDWVYKSRAFKQLNNSSLVLFEKLSKDPAGIIAAKIRLGTTSWNQEFVNSTPDNLIGAAALVDSPQPTAADIVRVCHDFIASGAESRIPELVNLLSRFGDKSLAEDYLNCGKEELYNAGIQWAKDHGYNIGEGYGSHRVRWGEKKK